MMRDRPYLNAAVGIVGLTLAAAAILGEADIGYRAAAVSAETSNPVTCTINQLGTSVWTNTCRESCRWLPERPRFPGSDSGADKESHSVDPCAVPLL